MTNLTELKQTSPKILIVDDDEYNLTILSSFLTIAGYQILLATDGLSALKIAENEKPDLVLLDILMPEMTGYEVCQYIKENPGICDTPVIFISSLHETKDIIKALKSGGVDYITKPFQAEEVTERVNTHLKLHLQNKELHELNIHLKESQDQLTKFAAHLLAIHEEEKILLSNEIHDKIGQILIALKIDMGIWKKKMMFLSENSNSQELLNRFNELVSIVDGTIRSVRKIISKLKSNDLEILGFIETAKLCAIEFEITNKIDCHIESSIQTLNLNEQQKVALYRILQEALSNVAQHANATSVEISLYTSNQEFIMEIIDNGIGFDKNKRPTKNAYGIINMKERIETLHGKLSITSKPGKGTRVKTEIPYCA